MSFDLTQIQPVFITADDYKKYWGVDLIEIFDTLDGADAFLFRTQTRLKAFINARTFRRFEWDKLSKFQEQCFCLALLEQAHYVIRNGDIASDSGYDVDRGVLLEPALRRELTLCDIAKDFLINCGLWSQQIKPRKRFGGFWQSKFDTFYSEAPVVGSDAYNEKYGKGGD